MKFVKGKKAEADAEIIDCSVEGLGVGVKWGPVKPRPVELSGKPAKQSPNPWIDRRYFDVMQARCVAAENMCKDLIHVITGDGGKALAKHDFDYLAAGEAIKRKKGRV